MQTQSTPVNVLDLTFDQLALWLSEQGQRPYRTGQILRWIHHRQMDDFSTMSDISKELRAKLAASFTVDRLPVEQTETSRDGTVKFLHRLRDGERIESVLIPERDHSTLCVSTQVGCAMGCAFCRTGSGGLVRNLTPGEIIAQVRDAALFAGEQGRLTNLVFMGMGEPLANYDNLVAALGIITSADHGLAFAGRRVTVSTAGLASKIPLLGADTSANLAISLNAATDEVRDRIMPVNKRWNMEALLAACRNFPLRKGRRITFEYVLLAGVNDTESDAGKLVKLLHGIPAKINLIPYNPHDESPFSRPAPEAVQRFQDILHDRHMTSVIRKSKGDDILAACGQLRANNR
ncbi:MAG: 23S rRNA (adenine(2503)-C(2))-methyltransferase RlmN [Desulfatibacillaceae bacterium]